MESIIQYRQMMADHKFFEVQKLIEVQLTLNSSSRHELLSIYIDCLKAQQKNLPINFVLELAEFESDIGQHDNVMALLNHLSSEAIQKYFIRIQKLKIKAADDKGQMDDLYMFSNDLMLNQFEKKIPTLPKWLWDINEKYFKQDFGLKLKELALTMLLQDYVKAEELTHDLIISSMEKASPKSISTKLIAVGEILKTQKDKGSLEIYQNYCFIAGHGFLNKTEYKSLVEMVIFYDEYKFQVLVLNLLDHLELANEAKEYALVAKSNPLYDFVYLDKYFTHLKKYFISRPANKALADKLSFAAPDLKLNGPLEIEIMSPAIEVENYDEEQRYLNLIKHQTYSNNELCDLAVSFLQAEMPRVALLASDKALLQANNDKEYLKASYLKLSCLLLLKDFRAGLDTCLQALAKTKTRDDVLSFLYGQAEIYIRLNQLNDAKEILAKILSIDSEYRLAKERLDKLNEI